MKNNNDVKEYTVSLTLSVGAVCKTDAVIAFWARVMETCIQNLKRKTIKRKRGKNYDYRRKMGSSY